MARDKKGRIIDGKNEGNTFTSENQPTSEAKSKGKLRKRYLKDLATALITGDRLEKLKGTAKKVGLDFTDKEYTLDIAMTLKQIEKALDDGDTKAFNAAMDRLLGKPNQTVETTITEVKPTKYEIVNDKDTKASS